MFQEIKKRVDKYSDSIYYEPMAEKEIIEFEKKVGNRLNSVYREFLTTFGLVQDLIEELNSSIESILEDVEYLRDILPDYFPIYVDVDEIDTIYLMSTSNPDSDLIYKTFDDNEKLGEIQIYKSLTSLVSDSILKIENGEIERCPNSEKIHCYEYSFDGELYDKIIKSFKAAGIKQSSIWHPKYYPDNIFGDEIAKFDFEDISLNFERDEDLKNYSIEFDEPILTKKEDSISTKIDQLLDNLNVMYEKSVIKLIETR